MVFVTTNAVSQSKLKIVVKKAGVVNLKSSDDGFPAFIQNMEMPSPEGNSEKSRLLRLKNEMELKYPRKSSGSPTAKQGSPVVSQVSGFEGNAYNNSVPNDNTLAISDSGIIVSCSNKRVFIYDTNEDTVIAKKYLTNYITSLGISGSRYDPKVIYDQNEDRFIMVFLVGTLHTNSKIAVCFSVSNDPLGDWNVYALPGDPLLTDHWTDYPAIAITEDEFFITGNLLEDNGSWQTSFNQSIIWQIDKHSGYNGFDSLTTQLWHDIVDDTVNIRNIHPVRGARKLYGPNQYFLSNKNFAAESDTVYLIEITGLQSSSSEQLNLTLLSNPDHYFMSPNGRQSIPERLATNDSRVLGAIRDDSWIQYVHNSMDTATGTAAVYHGTIENFENFPLVSGVILSDSVKDFGYPNIASTGIDPDEKECVIAFNYTSPLDTNGVACFYMDTNSNYSGFNYIKRGEAPIDILTDTTMDRWGDYFGIQRNYKNPCNVWTAGMYGKTNTNGTWIGKISVNDICREPTPTSQEDSLKPAFNNGSIFPNPSIDWITFDFELDESLFIKVELFDTKGGLIKVLYQDVALQGENRLTFNGFYLNQGMYILRILNNDKVLFTEKLVKQ